VSAFIMCLCLADWLIPCRKSPTDSLKIKKLKETHFANALSTDTVHEVKFGR
jgi:hypothetical protein